MSRNWLKSGVLAAFYLAGTVVCPSNCWAEIASFSGLGYLPDYTTRSDAKGISADGTTVVGFSTARGVIDREAFHWTAASGMVGLGHLPGGGDNSEASAASANGSVIVGWSHSTNSNPYNSSEAFKWTSADGMVGLGDLPDGWFASAAFDVSDDGSVVVGRGRNSAQYWQAVMWSNGNCVPLGSLPGGNGNSEAGAISGDGNTIVGTAGSTDPSGDFEAFRWTQQDGMSSLGTLPGGAYSSRVKDVSFDGSVVVGRSKNADGHHEAFRHTMAEGMVGLGDFPGGSFSSEAMGISADGRVVVGYGNTENGAEAFYWTPESGMLKLDDLLAAYGISPRGWTLDIAFDVSADGKTIVGRGTHYGNDEAWVVVIPEPGALGLLAVGGLGLLARRPRRR